MISYPPAKINIGLNVINRRPDNYHDIESVFYAIPFVDILEINKAENFNFATSGLDITGDPNDNLVVKAFKLLKENHNISNVSIHLHKQIPMGAGLGGGSADAAYTLTMLNDLFRLELSLTILKKYAAILGSDCPFFIESSPKYITGTGLEMCDLKIDLKGHFLWLINPGIHVSTKEAYAGIIPRASEHDLTVESQTKLTNWNNTIKNDFEATVFRIHPSLLKIKQMMYENGAIYASMSGSGSTMYAICKKRPTKTGTFGFEKIILL